MTVTDSPMVVVYWRPGCPYCARLRRRLRQLGVQTTEVDIWTDPTGPAAVRGYAGGNETVPTVVISGTAMVNPSAWEVLAAARRLAPEAVSISGPLPAARPTMPPVWWLAAWAVVIAAFAGSVLVDATGHGTLGWSLDVVAGFSYLTMRVLRRRSSARSTTRRSTIPR